MRVLYCIDAMAAGGTEKQLASLVAGLDRNRFQPFLCTLRPSQMRLDTLGCGLMELSLGSFASLDAPRRLARLRRFIVDQRIDIVQTFFQDSTIAGLCASLRTPVRARIACFRDLGFWRTRRNVWPLRLAYPYFDGFTANARAVADHVHAADGIALARIEVIHNGVALRPLSPDRFRAHPPLVGIVSNLNRPVKRVDLFLEAARHVRRAVPEAEFVIVGDGPQRAELLALAARLGIAPAVRFAGQVEDPGPYISSFDVGVLTSDNEGLSNSILEYMAAGIPTVARRVGGNPELVRHGETGMLVDSADPGEMARAVVSLLRNPARRRRFGDAARASAASRFSLETYVRQYEAYYHRLLH